MIPNYVDPDTLEAFLESRRAHKAPFTPRAYRLLMTKIERHHAEGYDVNLALEDAAISGWKSIYPRVKRQGYDMEQERAKERAALDKAKIDQSIAAMCAGAVKRVSDGRVFTNVQTQTREENLRLHQPRSNP